MNAGPPPRADDPASTPRVVPPPPRILPQAELAAPQRQLPVATPVAPPSVIPRATPPSKETSPAPPQRQRERGRLARWLDAASGSNAPVTSFTVSTIIHALLVILLGLLIIAENPTSATSLLVATIGAPPSAGASSANDLNTGGSVNQDWSRIVPLDERPIDVEPPRPRSAAPESPVPWDLGLDRETSRRLLERVEINPFDNLDSRNPQRRERLIGTLGGPTVRSEQAVERGLRWLAAHQRDDGSWHFNFQRSPACQGACTHSGQHPSTVAATSLALLCYLGAGYTHHGGPYQDVVRNGLYYLEKQASVTPHGDDYSQGTSYGMYVQGLTSLCLSEAAIMTRDPRLGRYAQRAVDYIIFAQDPQGGGWRYTPGQPGDMTVTGWQVMALKSARGAYLHVPATTFYGVTRFLDTLQSQQGAGYGYLATGREPVSTAVGLLSRMLTGWRREHPPLYRGIRYLMSHDPAQMDIYFNYYATLVLHHFGGPDWIVWNDLMRERLVSTQAQLGHENGSWHFSDAHNSSQQGGRLYNTCLAILTLEVYYRYLPIYGPDVLDSEF